MSELVLIAAVAANGVIGKDNQLLWHLPGDLKRFKALTTGQAVIMGRKTWESLPEKFRPLPGRRNLVISRNPAYAAAGAQVVDSFDAAVAACADLAIVFVIGGAEIYALALPRADRLELTELATSFEGDAAFPAIDRRHWRAAPGEQHNENGLDYRFVTYTHPD